MTKYKILVLLIVVGVVLVAAGAAYYYLDYLPNSSVYQQQAFNQSLSDSKKMIMAGQSSDVIPALEKSAQTATDDTQEALADINLGIAYLSSGLTEKGIALFKEVSINPKYPSQYRSTAAQDVLEYYISGKDTDFALKNIFTGVIWGEFIKEKNPDAKDLELGVVRAFEWVTALAPSFPAEYTLASKYAYLTIETSDPTQRAQYQTLALQHLAKGDTAYNAALDENKAFLQKNPTQVPPFTDYRLGVGLEHKAITLSFMYEQKVSSVTLASVESAFADTLAMLEKDPNLRPNIISGIYARYHFAVFYAHVGPQQYSQKILTTLAPMYNPTIQNANFFQGFLKTYGTDGIYYKTQDWNDMVLLSKLDPKFKSLLLSLGWKAADLK